MVNSPMNTFSSKPRLVNWTTRWRPEHLYDLRGSRRGADRFVLAQAFILSASRHSEDRSVTRCYPSKPHPIASPDSGASEKDCPFLTFDRDAYFGDRPRRKAFWIIDGYTISERSSTGTHAAGNELCSQLGQGRGRCLQWNSELLPERSLDPIVLSYGKIFPRDDQAPGADARGSARTSVTHRTCLPSRLTCTPPITCKIRRSFTTKKTCSAFRAGLSAARNKKWSPITPSCACRVRLKKSLFCFYLSRRTNETTCALGGA